MSILFFAICMLACGVGSIVGAGGGVIIKPLLDLIGVLPVSTVSFCSGCTVLAMSVVSLIRTRGNGVALRLKMTLPLALGAVAGGLIGSRLFDLVRQTFASETKLGAIQAILLTVLMIGTFVYVCQKDKIRSLHVDHLTVSLAIGLGLGMISSFLGIGGGPTNVAVLFFFFSMEAKEAAKNSIFIIMFSQIASVGISLVQGTVPDFSWTVLLCMIAGGIIGALLGAYISKRITGGNVETLLKILLAVIICMDFYNVLKFTVLA